VGASPGLSASFKVDPAQSSLVLQLFKDGVAARLGHDHVVHARVFSGTVVYDPRRPEASSVQVAVEAGVSDYWRKYVGLEGAVVGIDRYGESAPAGDVFKHFGFTPERVAEAVRSLLK